jgi:hypothetical protein
MTGPDVDKTVVAFVDFWVGPTPGPVHQGPPEGVGSFIHEVHGSYLPDAPFRPGRNTANRRVLLNRRRRLPGLLLQRIQARLKAGAKLSGPNGDAGGPLYGVPPVRLRAGAKPYRSARRREVRKGRYVRSRKRSRGLSFPIAPSLCGLRPSIANRSRPRSNARMRSRDRQAASRAGLHFRTVSV